jgi:hypothetical protein
MHLELLRTSPQQSQEPRGYALEQDCLADDENDRHRSVNPDMIPVQHPEPIRKVMENEKKITGHEKRIDRELDEESPQGLSLFLLGRRNAGHPFHFADGVTIGRARQQPAADFYLRARAFFLRSSSLLAEEYG